MHFTTVVSLEIKYIVGHGCGMRGSWVHTTPVKNDGFATAAFTVKCHGQWH